MLKKIEKLIIRDVRKWKGEHTFEFQDGTNLIKVQTVQENQQYGYVLL